MLTILNALSMKGAIMGTIFGYIRVSTLDQNTDMQEKALKTAYPDAVFRQEKKTEHPQRIGRG